MFRVSLNLWQFLGLSSCFMTVGDPFWKTIVTYFVSCLWGVFTSRKDLQRRPQVFKRPGTHLRNGCPGNRQKETAKNQIRKHGGKNTFKGTTWSCRNKCSLYKRVEGQVEKVDEGRQGGGEKKDLTDVIPRCLWAVDCGAKFSRAVLVHVLAPQHLRMSSRRHDKTTRDTTPLCFFRQVFPKLWGFPEPWDRKSVV